MAGRPAIQITQEMLRQAEELAGYGMTQEQIAAVLGISDRSLRRRKQDNDEFLAAMRRGKAKASAEVGRALYRRAKDGDIPAIRWWEMTRDGRSERVSSENRHEVTYDAETDARLARLLGGAYTGPASEQAGEDDAAG